MKTICIKAISVATAVMLASLCANAEEKLPSIERVQAVVEKADPSIRVQSVARSQFAGAYEVELSDGNLVFLSSDLTHAINGRLYRMTGTEVVDLTNERAKQKAQEFLQHVKPGELIIYPTKSFKGRITVFTDHTCPYCQKLHSFIPELNAKGVEVRYAAFPRAGMVSDAAKQMFSAWCSKDAPAKMNDLMLGKDIEKVQCKNPVIDQLNIGRKLGVAGTPTVIFDDGEMMPGFNDVATILKKIESL